GVAMETAVLAPEKPEPGRAVRETFAPISWSIAAKLAPMPSDAPVTITTLSFQNCFEDRAAAVRGTLLNADMLLTHRQGMRVSIPDAGKEEVGARSRCRK